MLCITCDSGSDEVEGEESWKVLIFDDFCHDVISPLIRVSELRSQGNEI